MELPSSPAVHRNKEYILEVLNQYIQTENQSLLEIGSGTGEHGVFFAKKFPNLKWQMSDDENNHDLIKAYIQKSTLKNILNPRTYLAAVNPFPNGDYNFVFTANTLHIMPWENAIALFEDLGANLKKNALVFLYGPFNYGGKYTSESNAQFDLWLKERNPASAIRNFEDVQKQMQNNSMELIHDYEMPANNRLLVFKHL